MFVGAKSQVEPATMPLVRQLLEVFDYLEIFYREPHLSPSALQHFSSPWVVHCPRHHTEINLARNYGVDQVKRSLQFAGVIGARYAIIHPGFITPTTDLTQAVRRAIPILRELTTYAQHHHVQLLLENVYSSNPEASRSIGCDLWELDQLITGAQCGFCLDFPHAVCAAVTLQREPQQFIRELTTLYPAMFHLYDGWQGCEYDQHLPLGQGNLDISSFLHYISDHYVTLEVHPPTLANFMTSYRYLQQLRS